MPFLDAKRQWQSWPALDKVAAGGADSAEMTQFLARITAPSAPRKAAYAALIDGLVADTVWPKITALYVQAAADSATSLINLKSSAYPLVNHGCTFAADAGWSGNGTSAWMDTGFNPNTAADPNMKADGSEGSIAAYIQTNDTTGAFSYAAHTAGNVAYLWPLFAGDISSASGGGRQNATASGTTRGNALIVRTSSSSLQIYKNGTARGTAGGAATAGPSIGNFALFSVSGGTGNWLAVQMSATMLGGALTPTQALAYMSRINAYMAALGINTY
jgi:hypothetical protein